MVDDHAVVREGLIKLINQENDMTVCGEAEDGYLLMKILEKVRPDIIVVDLSLTQTNGIDIIKNVKNLYPDILFIVFSMHDEQIFAERAIRAGASGYVMKCEKPSVLINSIRKIVGGKLHFSDKMTEILLHKALNVKDDEGKDLVETLSDREFQVFQFLGRGVGTRQIADELNLSIKTIDAFRENIKHKLDLKNASELTQYAIKWIHSNNIV